MNDIERVYKNIIKSKTVKEFAVKFVIKHGGELSMKWLKRLALSFVKGLIRDHVEKLELLEPKIVKLLKKNRVGSVTSRPQVADAIVELAKEEIIKLIERI